MTDPARTQSPTTAPPAADCAVGATIPELHQTIDLLTLVRYSGATYDFNRIHFDDEFAQAAGLGGVIGHGLLGMGLISRALTDWVGDSGLVRSLAVRFVSSSRLGDRLTVRGEVTERSAEGDRTLLTLRMSCVNQESAEIIGNCVAKVLLPSAI